MKCNFRNQTRDSQWSEHKSLFQEIFNKTLEKLQEKRDVEVTAILVKERKIHVINKEYRSIDRPTDVITFAALEGDCFEFEDVVELGDIFINVDAVVKQAQEYGHSVKREIGFLFVHGLLHCFGYDHNTQEEEQTMFELQKEILDPIVGRNDEKV